MRSSLIYLDSHVVVWLYSGDLKKLSDTCKNLINQHNLFISPIVKLELQYLLEIKRISTRPTEILSDLTTRIGLQICKKPFEEVINQAMSISWTRDPFDRLIVANAALNDNILLSKDKSILSHYNFAEWQ